MMGFYERRVLPRLIDFACGMKPIMRQRAKIVGLAQGHVLEVGVGSGLNLPFYDPSRVETLVALEPSAEMLEIAGRAAGEVRIEPKFLQASAEDIPLDAKSFDTVVVTYTLCTIPDVLTSLQEMSRVLKPGGTLIFCEHGLAPDERVRRSQARWNGLWSRVAGGCQLNRDIPELLKTAGFEVDSLDQMYLPGWKPATFNSWGLARTGKA